MVRLAATTAALLLLMACNPNNDTGAAEPGTSSTESSTSSDPSTTTSMAPNTSTTSSTSTTTTVPATTTTLSPSDAALQTAQQLATAYADGDWASARTISPQPAYTDAELDAGYAGLEASTVLLGDIAESAARVQLWLLMVAHEIDSGNERTSLYCIEWDYLPATGTIDKISGELVDRYDGFSPPSDSARGAFVCSPDFNVGAAEQTAPQQPVPGASGAPVPPSAGFDSSACTFDGHPLYGPIIVVSNSFGADVRIYKTVAGPYDLRVRIVEFELADDCGEWDIQTIDPTGLATRVYFSNRREDADLKVFVSDR